MKLHSSHALRIQSCSVSGSFFKFFQGSLNSAFYQNAGIRKAVQVLCLHPIADPVQKQTDKHSGIRPADKVLLLNRHIRNSRIALQKVCLQISHSSTISRTVISSIAFFANNVVNAVEISTFVRSFIAFPPPSKCEKFIPDRLRRWNLSEKRLSYFT